jgi:phosphopantothenoylcysteine decarboxylase/phosphopantothenate--cysteine ligase
VKEKTKVLKNKNILLGITGGVAAYKAVDLVRRLKEQGALVNVIMTEASKYFITQMSLEVASENKVHTDMFENPLSHVSLGRDADVMIIAPATANIIAKFANGIADDLLSTCFLAVRGKVILAPSMNWRMYENPVVQKNLEYLKQQGIIQIGPEKGFLACGEEGVGRMAETTDIVEAIKGAISNKDFLNKKIVVTAGPTREYLDPVRFVSNRSSGKMGFAAARACVRRGADVTLISGPSSLKTPCGLKSFISVDTTKEMRDAVFQAAENADILIMAAAPADFTPENRHETKIEKSDRLTVNFKNTQDILHEINQRKNKPLVVGFAAETGSKLDRARKKLAQKGADMIVFNDVAASDSGFDVETNRITIISKHKETALPLMTKDEAAEKMLDAVAEFFDKKE